MTAKEKARVAGLLLQTRMRQCESAILQLRSHLSAVESLSRALYLQTDDIIRNRADLAHYRNLLDRDT